MEMIIERLNPYKFGTDEVDISVTIDTYCSDERIQPKPFRVIITLPLGATYAGNFHTARDALAFSAAEAARIGGRT